MSQNTIAVNLRRIRRGRGLSQGAVAQRAGLSRAAYGNIETGKSEPRVSNLQAIAGVLKVPLEQLVAPVQPLRAVRFRSNKRMRTRDEILVDVARWLRDFNDVEEILGDAVASRLAEIRRRVEGRSDMAVAAALIAREAFGLDGEEPVRDICGLLESEGVKVHRIQLASPDFFGLSVAPRDGGPAVVVNTAERISVERWIFTAAHELGHLILHLSDYDVDQTEEQEEHEAEANAFAAEFLMPEVSFRKEWDETSGRDLVTRVLKVKRIFRVSYRTVLARIAPAYTGPGGIWKRFQVEFARQYGRTLKGTDEPLALAQDAFRASFPESRSAGEPDTLAPVDFVHDRLPRLVRRAVEEEKISLGRGAEVLGLSLAEMRDLTASWVA